MTDQTKFTPEIKAEAERLWHDACVNSSDDSYGEDYGIGRLALCRLLVATGFKPPVDPIEAKAREIVAEQVRALGVPKVFNPQQIIDGIMAGKMSVTEIAIAKAGILAGMEMGKS